MISFRAEVEPRFLLVQVVPRTVWFVVNAVAYGSLHLLLQLPFLPGKVSLWLCSCDVVQRVLL